MLRFPAIASGHLLAGVLTAVACSPGEHARAPEQAVVMDAPIDINSVAGTYNLRVCRMACPPPGATSPAQGALLRRETLILTSGPTGFDARRDSVGLLLSGFFRGPGNGCYTLAIMREDLPSYAYTLGRTHWELDSTRRMITFSLFSSPDAGYGVRATLRDGVLRGEGESSGAGAAAVDYPVDVVEGERVGPPDLTPCIAAVGPAWKEIRSPSTRAHHRNGEW